MAANTSSILQTAIRVAPPSYGSVLPRLFTQRKEEEEEEGQASSQPQEFSIFQKQRCDEVTVFDTNAEDQKKIIIIIIPRKTMANYIPVFFHTLAPKTDIAEKQSCCWKKELKFLKGLLNFEIIIAENHRLRREGATTLKKIPLSPPRLISFFPLLFSEFTSLQKAPFPL